MADPKKPGIGILIGLGKKPPPADDAGPAGGDDMEDKMLHSAASDLISAIKAGDAASVVDCMKDMWSMIDKDDEPEGDESDEQA